MTTTRITTDQLTSVLDGLFGCESTATQVTTPAPLEGPSVVATYSDCDEVFRFAIVCELGIANSLGAALTMIPPGGAEDATLEGVVPDNLGENIYEVLNICSALLADYHCHRIVLDKVYTPDEEISEDIKSKLDSADNLAQFEYELERYQSGKISVLKVIS